MKQISFNAEMTKATLNGKTQTRICIKIKNKLTRDWALSSGIEWIKEDLKDKKYPYSIREKNGSWYEYSLEDFIKNYSEYQIGDILWVREPVKLLKHTINCDGEYFGTWIKYLADGKEILFDKFTENVLGKKWFDNCQGVPNGCLKEMARIFLKVTNVRIERLQDISYEDIKSEGLCGKTISTAEMSKYTRYVCNAYDDYSEEQYIKAEWIKLWDSTTPKDYKWEDNPYVFVYEFERVEKGNII